MEQLPIEGDYVVAYATVSGYEVHQHDSNGSHFIQAFIKIFAQYAHCKSVQEMLTMVIVCQQKMFLKTNKIGCKGLHKLNAVTCLKNRKTLFIKLKIAQIALYNLK